MYSEVVLTGKCNKYFYRIKAYPIKSMFASKLCPVFVTNKYKVYLLEIWDEKDNYLAHYNPWKRWIHKPDGKQEKVDYKKVYNMIVGRLSDI